LTRNKCRTVMSDTWTAVDSEFIHRMIHESMGILRCPTPTCWRICQHIVSLLFGIFELCLKNSSEAAGRVSCTTAFSKLEPSRKRDRRLSCGTTGVDYRIKLMNTRWKRVSTQLLTGGRENFWVWLGTSSNISNEFHAVYLTDCPEMWRSIRLSDFYRIGCLRKWYWLDLGCWW
jgi:hypothetical protein